jgi:hypothetical protein
VSRVEKMSLLQLRNTTLHETPERACIRLKRYECGGDIITHGKGATQRQDHGMAHVLGPDRCHLSDKLKREIGMYILSCESSHYAEIREAPVGEPSKVQDNEARVSEVGRQYGDRRLRGI